MRAPRWRQVFRKACGHAVVVGHDEDALAAELDHEVVAALADLVDVPDADPAAHEDVLELPVEHARIGERRLRQRRRALERLARALELADRQGQRLVGHRHARTSPRNRPPGRAQPTTALVMCQVAQYAACRAPRRSVDRLRASVAAERAAAARTSAPALVDRRGSTPRMRSSSPSAASSRSTASISALPMPSPRRLVDASDSSSRDPRPVRQVSGTHASCTAGTCVSA